MVRSTITGGCLEVVGGLIVAVVVIDVVDDFWLTVSS